MEYIEGATTNGTSFTVEASCIECFEEFNDGTNVGVIIVMKSGASFRTDTYDYHGLKSALKMFT